MIDILKLCNTTQVKTTKKIKIVRVKKIKICIMLIIKRMIIMCVYL